MANWLTRLLGVRQDAKIPGPDWKPIDQHARPTAAYRTDQWQNPYLGYGTGRDKVYAGNFVAPYRLQDNELLALFNGSDIAARVVETFVDLVVEWFRSPNAPAPGTPESIQRLPEALNCAQQNLAHNLAEKVK